MDREHPRYERVRLRPSVERVLKEVAEAYGVHVQGLLEGQRGVANEARKIGMYLVKRLCDLTLQETAERFRVGSYGVVGWACHGVRLRLEVDRGFKSKVQAIEKKIYQQKT
jgi:chromosomal replication initiation ATPase DnaA